MKFKIFIITVTAFFLQGCVSMQTKYSATAENQPPSKPANCEFKIQSTLPDPSQYEEIGTINGCFGVTDILRYKAGIREKVCKAGGDLVVGQVNGYGVYCISTVFVKK